MLVTALVALACSPFYDEVELAREPVMGGYPISQFTQPWTIWRNTSATSADDISASYNESDGSIRIARALLEISPPWFTQVLRPVELRRAREYRLCIQLDAPASAGDFLEMAVDLGWPTYEMLGYAYLPFPLLEQTSTCATFSAPEAEEAGVVDARVVLNAGGATGVVHVRSLALRRCPSELDATEEAPPPPLPSLPTSALVWSDEFDEAGGVNTSSWVYDILPPGAFNDELQAYGAEPANSFVQDGALSILATCAAAHGGAAVNISSARITTRGVAAWGPGHRVDVRARIPTALGSWPAIWLLPENYTYGAWPGSGEIDILEHVGCNEGEVLSTVHTAAYNSSANTQVSGAAYPRPVDAWHTYSLEWREGGLRFLVDDAPFFSFERQRPAEQGWRVWPFDQEFHLLLNLAVGGEFGAYCLEEGEQLPCPDDGVFARMDVDYVRVHALRDFSPPPPPPPPLEQSSSSGSSGASGDDSGSGRSTPPLPDPDCCSPVWWAPLTEEWLIAAMASAAALLVCGLGAVCALRRLRRQHSMAAEPVIRASASADANGPAARDEHAGSLPRRLRLSVRPWPLRRHAVASALGRLSSRLSSSATASPRAHPHGSRRFSKVADPDPQEPPPTAAQVLDVYDA